MVMKFLKSFENVDDVELRRKCKDLFEKVSDNLGI